MKPHRRHLPAALLVAACAVAAAGPAVAADLAAARSCVDHQLLDAGVRDVTLLADEASGNGRDALVAALSDATRRSRALRALARLGDGAVPEFALRSNLAPSDRASPVVAIDLSLVSARDGVPVPGTAARTSATMIEAEGRAEVRKLGRTLSVPAVGADARAQALRAVADVAAIELAGRIGHVPYWRCFGVAESDPAVAGEIRDWYDTLAARPPEIIGWFQQQLRQRRAYDGPVDGAVSPAFKTAVADYRERLGLSREPKLSLDFFQAWLAADHAALAAPRAAVAVAAAPVAPPAPAAAPAPSTPPPPAAVPAPAPAPAAVPRAAAAPALQLQIAAREPSQPLVRGQAVQLAILPSRDAHVWCFHQDEQRRIRRIFPNQFHADSLVTAASGMQLPGAMRFEILVDARSAAETVACYATERDVAPQLPTAVTVKDFKPLALATLDQVQGAFARAADGAIAHDAFVIRAH